MKEEEDSNVSGLGCDNAAEERKGRNVCDRDWCFWDVVTISWMWLEPLGTYENSDFVNDARKSVVTRPIVLMVLPGFLVSNVRLVSSNKAISQHSSGSWRLNGSLSSSYLVKLHA